jgi:hypothetical protein
VQLIGREARKSVGEYETMIYVIVVLAFLVVIAGSITLGRALQREGRDLEKGRKDPPVDR